MIKLKGGLTSLKLKIYSVINAPKHFNPKVSNRLLNLFSSSNQEDVELTNIVQLNSEIKHLVFNLKDVYYSGTQKNGISNEFPFTQTINVFISKNNIYIENKGIGYIENIKKYFSKKYDFSFKELMISNLFIAKVKQQLDIRILDIYFVDSFGDKLGQLELLNEYDINNLPSDVIIQSITFQPLNINKNYITIRREGEMSLSLNTIESFNDWLLFLEKEISDA